MKKMFLYTVLMIIAAVAHEVILHFGGSEASAVITAVCICLLGLGAE